jgi:hypothetical protein
MIKNTFIPNNLNTNTKVMASYLPLGQAFNAKDIFNSNFNKLMRALAVEFGRDQSILYELSQEYNISKTNNLIEEWENALGIPDDCFSNTVSITQRQLQCVAKFAKMNIATEKDWIDLARFFGYNIAIEHGDKYMVLPFTLPFILGTGKTSRFTIIIVFLDLPKPSNVFPLTLPFTLGAGVNLIQCLYEHLKPANVKILYKFLG